MSRRPRSAQFCVDPTNRRFEWLECRHLLSFVVARVEPSPGARLTQAPTALIVTFNQPIEPSSLSRNDIQVTAVADDGGLSPLAAAIQGLGPEEDQLVLRPGRALTSGRYRILLANESGLQSTEGETLDVDGSGEEFRTLGDFWVDTPGIGLDDAIDLGTPGPIPTSVGGALDFGVNPQDVRLYRITLPAGRFWRLGLEVTSQRDGGTLDPALALFDGVGKPIAASDDGRRDARYDPYLFIGLGEGTYYIGVSGTGNLPGTAGGYDPAARTPGSTAGDEAGGPFTLHLVADPADTPITLLGMDLDRHDPKASTPTGFTLQFSGAIRFDSLSRGVEVVDQGGRTWPVAASDYLESEARISFLFQDRLPEGDYIVRLPGHGGLVDLAGLSPIATGQSSPVLGRFSVGPRAATEDPHDLGALLPGPGAVVGLSGRASLAPGESVTYRVVIPFPDWYHFQSRYTGGPLAIRRTGPGGTVSLDPGAPDLWNARNPMFLIPGEYLFQMTAVGSRPVEVDFIIKGPWNIRDLMLANGVGQGPALSLRLIAPERRVMNPPTPGPVPPQGDPPSLRPTPPAPPPPPTIPLSPVGPLPTQPGPGGADTPPFPPRTSTIPNLGVVANLSASTLARRVSPLTVPGFVGDLIGRPSPERRPSPEFEARDEPRGAAAAPGSLGLLQEFGRERGMTYRIGPRDVVPPSDDLLPPEADGPAAVPIPLDGVTMRNVIDGASREPIPPGTDLPRPLNSVIGSLIEVGREEGQDGDGDSDSDSDVVVPSAPAPVATNGAGSSPGPFQLSSLISRTSLVTATAIGLASFLLPHPRRWITRLWSGHARDVGLAVRPGSSATTGRGGRLP